MAKKPSAKKAEQVELDAFTERYELLSSVYADPVETLFEIMTHQDAPMDLRARCAVDLMSFRFPKLKALELKQDKTQTVNMTINLTAPTPKKELDITPVRPALQIVGEPK